ncbi:MAG: methyltransferase domain-containing protein [Bacteroidales bacterium]|nr:methyltransferase domain-containing protein [Bacteroidales bacterium]
MAITVDYSLHITTHYKHKHSIITTIKDVSFPIIVCGFATAFEFLALVFVGSESLHELGILAAISVITAAFFTMVVMPHILDVSKKSTDETEEKNGLEKILDKITNFNFHRKRGLLFVMLAFSIVAWFFIGKVEFESDMMKMNYMSEDLMKAEENLNKINHYKLNSIYLAAKGKNLQDALMNNEILAGKLKRLKDSGQIKSFTNPGTLLFSDSLQREKIKLWNSFWSETKKNQVFKSFEQAAKNTGFKPNSFKAFYETINKKYEPLSGTDFETIENNFFSDNITENQDLTTVLSVIKVEDENKEYVTNQLNEIHGVVVIDRKSALSGIVDVLGRDFNNIANISLLLILCILIVAFGRFELGFITFIPIFLSWVWTLGIMGITGIKFNIFNIIISSFITGLGIDYSIYIMQGLVQGFKSDNKNLLSYKTCILISVLISISGTGVLILAKHPALNSIALISIIGLLSVVLISYTFEIVLFNWLTTKNGKNRVSPLTVSDIVFTIIPLTISLILSVGLHVVFLILLLLPLKKMHKQKILHYLLVLSIRISVKLMLNTKVKTVNSPKEDFKTPSIIVANHQSHLDLPVLLKLSPKIIVLTTNWVWNNPVYALLIRYLEFYPVTEGYEFIIEKIEKKIGQGYSILVFPEGSRSADSKIKRFHKGAFLLAERLNLDILPIMIHGAGDCMNKGENHLKGGTITVKIYPRIKSNDPEFGEDYHIRTKSVLAFFRREYQNVKEEFETPSYFRKKLIRNYIYKGPVIEWYTRVKTSMEKNYELMHKHIPCNATIVDIGCGYGMMSYMLSFLSEDRTILGIDYDADKIELASHCLSKNNKIDFVCADAVSYPFEKSDVFILSDVLHYLPFEKQEMLLARCIKNLNDMGVIIVRDANKDMKRNTLDHVIPSSFQPVRGLIKPKGINCISFRETK